MAKLNFENKWILITGASGGLGRSIALYLAKNEKANLVISARRIEQLQQLKEEIETYSNSKVIFIQTDLSKRDDVEKLFHEAVKVADIDAIINNAGITYYGLTDINRFETFETIIDVNLKALMWLTLRFLEYFKEKGKGAILNITSEAGLIPTPYQTVYSASKHAAQVFTEALRAENRKNGIIISSFAPGGIATEMLTKSGLDKKHGMDSPFNMNPDVVARLAVKSFKKKKFISVPGFINKMTVCLARFLPRKVIAFASEGVYRPI